MINPDSIKFYINVTWYADDLTYYNKFKKQA